MFSNERFFRDTVQSVPPPPPLSDGSEGGGLVSFGAVDDDIRRILARYVSVSVSTVPNCSSAVPPAGPSGRVTTPLTTSPATGVSATSLSPTSPTPPRVHLPVQYTYSFPHNHSLDVSSVGGGTHAHMLDAKSPIPTARALLDAMDGDHDVSVQIFVDDLEEDLRGGGNSFPAPTRASQPDDQPQEQEDGVFWGNVALEVEARLHHKSSLLARTVQLWRSRAEQRRAAKQRQLLMAEGYYGHCLRFGAFRRWQRHFHSRWRLVQQQELADRNYTLTAMGRPFAAWRRLAVDVRRRQREGLADIYHAAACRGAAQCWNRWLALWHTRRMAAQLASLTQYRLVRTFYAKWLSLTAARRAHGFMGDVLAHKHAVHTAFGALVRWRRALMRRRVHRLAAREEAVGCMAALADRALLAGRFAAWAQQAKHVITHRGLATLADGARMALLKGAFSRWARCHAANRVGAALLAARRTRAKQLVLGTWVGRRREAIADRSNETAAVLFSEAMARHTHLVRPFMAWRRHCSDAQLLRSQSSKALGLRSDLLADVAVDVLRGYAHAFLPSLGYGGGGGSPSSPPPPAPWHAPLSNTKAPLSRGGNPFIAERRGHANALNLNGAEQHWDAHHLAGGGVPSAAAASRQDRCGEMGLDGHGAGSGVADLIRRQRSPVPLRGGGGGLPLATSSSRPSHPSAFPSSADNASLPTPDHYPHRHDAPQPASPATLHAVAVLRRKVAEYGLWRQEEPLWAEALRSATAEYHRRLSTTTPIPASSSAVGALDEEDAAALNALAHRMAGIRGKQQALAALREEIVVIRHSIAATLQHAAGSTNGSDHRTIPVGSVGLPPPHPSAHLAMHTPLAQMQHTTGY